MIDRQIICSISEGDAYHKVILVEPKGSMTLGCYSIDELGSNIYNMCYYNDVNKVHLYGASDFLKKICEDVYNENSLTFNVHPVEIEVN